MAIQKTRGTCAIRSTGMIGSETLTKLQMGTKKNAFVYLVLTVVLLL